MEWVAEMGTCGFTASGFDRAHMENLVEVLGAMGLSVDCAFSASGRTARVTFTGLPSAREAEARRTRGAGRRSQGISLPSGSVFDCETSCREFLDWQEGHTAAEGMERLGLSRSTYFRRLRAIRERADEQDRVNAERARDSEGRHLPPVTYRLVDTR